MPCYPSILVYMFVKKIVIKSWGRVNVFVLLCSAVIFMLIAKQNYYIDRTVIDSRQFTQ